MDTKNPNTQKRSHEAPIAHPLSAQAPESSELKDMGFDTMGNVSEILPESREQKGATTGSQGDQGDDFDFQTPKNQKVTISKNTCRFVKVYS